MRNALLLSLLLLGCSTPPNKFADDQIVSIHSLKDRRRTDSLVRWLSHVNPTYRNEAALALASVQDTTAALALGALLLEDADVSVRTNAAFALGQTGGYLSVNALLPGLSDKDSFVVREVLEALGKTVKSMDRPALLQFEPADTIQAQGMAYALYQLMLRKQADSLSTAKAASLLTSSSPTARMMAAHYFSRGATVMGGGFEASVLAATADPSANVRMAAVAGLRHIPAEQSEKTLRQVLTTDPDHRVRINAVRAIQNLRAAALKPLLILALRDAHPQVRVAASEAIRVIGKDWSLPDFEEALQFTKEARPAANLLAATVHYHQPVWATDTLIRRIQRASAYDKVWYLGAMGEINRKAAFDWLNTFVADTLQPAAVQTASVSGLVSMNQHGVEGVTDNDFLMVYKQLLKRNDPISAAGIGAAIADEKLSYKKLLSDYTFLLEAKNRFQLPRDVDGLIPLDAAIAYLEGRKPAPPVNTYNHPIPWEKVKKISKTAQAVIETTRGVIRLQLHVEDSPGSVANFAELAQSGYFDGRFVHRVVPNFVFQTGCRRGDGQGSEDYSIRSEFGRRRYAEGSVGMASSGKDTEGTQWFITHSPTPHLYGRYTIFATVVSGAEVVHALEVGDQITHVKID